MRDINWNQIDINSIPKDITANQLESLLITKEDMATHSVTAFTRDLGGPFTVGKLMRADYTHTVHLRGVGDTYFNEVQAFRKKILEAYPGTIPMDFNVGVMGLDKETYKMLHYNAGIKTFYDLCAIDYTSLIKKLNEKKYNTDERLKTIKGVQEEAAKHITVIPFQLPASLINSERTSIREVRKNDIKKQTEAKVEVPSTKEILKNMIDKMSAIEVAQAYQLIVAQLPEIMKNINR